MVGAKSEQKWVGFASVQKMSLPGGLAGYHTWLDLNNFRGANLRRKAIGRLRC